jgi:hypothetical protein
LGNVILKFRNNLGITGAQNAAKTAKTKNYKAKQINRIEIVVLSAKPLFSGSSPFGAARKN